MSNTTRTSPRMDAHYCRECGAYFEHHPGLTNVYSPHTEEFLHRYAKHPNIEAEHERCSRYCTARAQSEEIKAGHRLYGKGIEHTKPVTSYDSIFPEED